MTCCQRKVDSRVGSRIGILLLAAFHKILSLEEVAHCESGRIASSTLSQLCRCLGQLDLCMRRSIAVQRVRSYRDLLCDILLAPGPGQEYPRRCLPARDWLAA